MASSYASFLPWLTIGLPILTFLCDLVTPQDPGPWMLYLPAIGFALLWKGRRVMIGFTAVVLLLSIAGMWLSPTVPPDRTVINWIVFALACVVLAGICWWLEAYRKEWFQNTQQAQLALEAALAGAWSWDVSNNLMRGDARFKELYGFGTNDPVTFDSWISRVHPEDRHGFQDRIRTLLESRRNHSWQEEFRTVHPTMGLRWIEGIGQVIRNPSGRAVYFAGINLDITPRKRTEQQLREAQAAARESEERFRIIADTAPVLIWMAGIDNRCLYFNKRWLDYTGRTLEEELGDGWTTGLHPDDRDRCLSVYRDAFDRREPFDMEYRLRQGDGSYGWIHDHGVPQFFADGTFCGYVGACIDVTARKRAEEHLHRTQFAMDQAVDAVYWIDPQAKILYTNEAASEMLGYTADEFLHMTVHDLNPNFPPEVWPAFWEETREKKVISLETVHLAKDGRRIPIDIRVTFLAYGGQEFHCAYVRDISERKQADDALRASQERFELAARATIDGIWDWNILTGEQYWSDRNFELFGLEPGGFTPSYDAWLSVVHPDDVDRVHQTTCRHLETREPYDIEVRVRMKDGSYRWFRDQGQAVWDSSGRPARMVGSISDVTERKTAEAVLRNAHAELERRVAERTAQLAMANRSLQDENVERKRAEKALRLTQFTVDRAAQGIFWVGPQAEILYVNDAACVVLGYSRDELLRMRVHDIDPNFPPEIWPAHWEELKRRGSFTFESSQQTKAGGVRYTEVTVNYLEYEGQEYNCANVRDVTERKLAADAVRDSELRYKLLTEATFDGIAIHDRGVLLEVNAGLERMFGYEPGELLGRSIWDLIADEFRELVLANMKNGVEGPYEAVGRRKDGTTFPGEVVVRPYRYRGKEVRLVAGRDITERKHLEAERLRYTEELERQVDQRTAEIARLESERAQTERLAAMGRLAAGVAHEINNPIAGIKNAFTLVKQAVDPAHPHAEFVGMIDREIARVSSIVQNMYQLYRPESGKGETVELSTMMNDIQALFAKQLQQRRLTLVIDVEPGLDRLDVPRRDLLQVLLNLLNNAIDSSSTGQTITLTFRVEEQAIRIAVSDRGAGISPEVLPHIFDPFYTTKTGSDQKGMGLGLSVSQSLVMAMGGKIEVETQLNLGTTFCVVLPRQEAIACGRGVNVAEGNKEVVTDEHTGTASAAR